MRYQGPRGSSRVRRSSRVAGSFQISSGPSSPFARSAAPSRCGPLISSRSCATVFAGTSVISGTATIIGRRPFAVFIYRPDGAIQTEKDAPALSPKPSEPPRTSRRASQSGPGWVESVSVRKAQAAGWDNRCTQHSATGFDEGRYRGGCRLRRGAQPRGHRRQRSRHQSDRDAPAWQENDVFADAGYTGADKRPEHADRDVAWNIAIKRSIIKALPKALRDLAEPVERALAQVRAWVEHPFHIVKNLFRHKRLRYRGLAKNTAQLHTLFALANLVIVKKALLVQSPAG